MPKNLHLALPPIRGELARKGCFSAAGCKLRLVAASTIPQSGQPEEEGKQFDTLQGEGGQHHATLFHTVQHFTTLCNSLQHLC